MRAGDSLERIHDILSITRFFGTALSSFIKKKVMDGDLGGDYFRKLIAHDYVSWINLDI